MEGGGQRAAFSTLTKGHRKSLGGPVENQARLFSLNDRVCLVMHILFDYATLSIVDEIALMQLQAKHDSEAEQRRRHEERMQQQELKRRLELEQRRGAFGCSFVCTVCFRCLFPVACPEAL